jgi:ABC-type glycerol-3-phosphate transport system permease component
VTVGALAVLGLAPTAWGLHRAMRGTGSLLSSFVGLLMALGASAIIVPVAVAGSSLGLGGSVIRSTAGLLIAIESVAVGTLVMSSVALEWSHTEHVGESGVQVSLSGGPIQGGALLGASLRF